MPSTRSQLLQFNKNWALRRSYATQNKIPSSALNSFYQLDYQRLAQGSTPYTNTEFVAAMNAATGKPNVAYAQPSVKPQAIPGNAISDLLTIGKGLTSSLERLVDPLDWPGEIKSTVGDLKYFGSSLSDLAQGHYSKFFEDFSKAPFMAFIPGVADAAMVAQGGWKMLAEHPLMSALDVLPITDDIGGAVASDGTRAALTDSLHNSFTYRLLKGEVGFSKAVDEEGKTSLIPKHQFSRLGQQAFEANAPKGLLSNFVKPETGSFSTMHGLISLTKKIGLTRNGVEYSVGSATHTLADKLFMSPKWQKINTRMALLQTKAVHTIDPLIRELMGHAHHFTPEQMAEVYKSLVLNRKAHDYQNGVTWSDQYIADHPDFTDKQQEAIKSLDYLSREHESTKTYIKNFSMDGFQAAYLDSDPNYKALMSVLGKRNNLATKFQKQATDLYDLGQAKSKAWLEHYKSSQKVITPKTAITDALTSAERIAHEFPDASDTAHVLLNNEYLDPATNKLTPKAADLYTQDSLTKAERALTIHANSGDKSIEGLSALFDKLHSLPLRAESKLRANTLMATYVRLPELSSQISSLIDKINAHITSINALSPDVTAENIFSQQSSYAQFQQDLANVIGKIQEAKSIVGKYDKYRIKYPDFHTTHLSHIISEADKANVNAVAKYIREIDPKVKELVSSKSQFSFSPYLRSLNKFMETTPGKLTEVAMTESLLLGVFNQVLPRSFDEILNASIHHTALALTALLHSDPVGGVESVIKNTKVDNLLTAYLKQSFPQIADVIGQGEKAPPLGVAELSQIFDPAKVQALAEKVFPGLTKELGPDHKFTPENALAFVSKIITKKHADNLEFYRQFARDTATTSYPGFESYFGDKTNVFSTPDLTKLKVWTPEQVLKFDTWFDSLPLAKAIPDSANWDLTTKIRAITDDFTNKVTNQFTQNLEIDLAKVGEADVVRSFAATSITDSIKSIAQAPQILARYDALHSVINELGLGPASDSYMTQLMTQLMGMHTQEASTSLADLLGPNVAPNELQAIVRSFSTTWRDLREAGYDPIYVHRIRSGITEKNIGRFNLLKETIPGISSAKLARDKMVNPVMNPWLSLSMEGREVVSQATTEEMWGWLGKSGMIRNAADVREKYTQEFRRLQSLKKIPEYVGEDKLVNESKHIDDMINQDYMQFTPSQYIHNTALLKASFQSRKDLLIPRELMGYVEDTLQRDKQNMLTKTLDQSTRLFKFSILKLSARFAMHVVAGGLTMVMANEDLGWFASLPHAVQALRAGNIPLELTALPPELDVANSLMGVQAGRSAGRWFMTSMLERIGVKDPMATADAVSKYSNAVTNLTETVSSIYKITTYLNAKSKGMSEDEAMSEVYKTFSNLNAMSPVERNVFKRIFPFYAFSKLLITYAMQYPENHPYRAMILGATTAQQEMDQNTALPQSLDFLLPFTSQNYAGNQSFIDFRQINPFRTMGNLFTLTGFIQGINPIMSSLMQATGSNVMTGSAELYPATVYNALTGAQQSSRQDTAYGIIQQFIPEFNVVDHFLKLSQNMKDLARYSPSAYRSQLYQYLNFPWVPQTINVPQVKEKAALARYKQAISDMSFALSTGNFSTLQNYSGGLLPYAGYYITPEQFQSIYNQYTQASQAEKLPVTALIVKPKTKKI